MGIFFTAYFKSNAGGLTIPFAMILTVLVLATGIAIDYSNLSHKKSESQYAADAAILAGVKAVEEGLENGLTQEEAILVAEQIVKNAFASNMGGTPHSLDADKLKITLSRTKEFGTVGTLAYSGDVEMSMGLLTGRKKGIYTLNSEAKYARGLVNYIELHILVDTSASMGLPSTNADQARLGSLKGCSFACHSEVGRWRAHGITFRVDVVRNAVLQILDIFEDKGYTDDRMSISVYTFGNNLATGVSDSTDLSAVRTFVNTIDLRPDSGTNINNVLNSLTSRLPKSGDGKSKDDRKVFVAVFTDGLTHGGAYSNPSIHGLKVLNPADCNGIKNTKEATLFVFNVEYIANLIGLRCPTGHPYCAIEHLMKPHIEPNMKTCASDPEYSLPAETPEQIEASIEVFTELIEERALAISK